jgi:hypothetical protein
MISLGSMYNGACQRRYVCPAFQSSFILDENKTNAFFSQFGHDSMPKSSLSVNKNKNGIVVRVKYHQKQKEMNTVKMQMTYPPPIDSVLFAGLDLNSLNESEIDSILALAPQRRVSHNRDQHIYMMVIGQLYNWDPPAIGQRQNVEDPSPVVTNEKKKKGLFNRNRKRSHKISEDNPQSDGGTAQLPPQVPEFHFQNKTSGN